MVFSLVVSKWCIQHAMFKENGALRTATSKCALKNALAKPRLSHQKADILIVDASAQLWVTAWPGKDSLSLDS